MSAKVLAPRPQQAGGKYYYYVKKEAPLRRGPKKYEIPDTLREQVINLHNQGLKRNTISGMMQISFFMVSRILNEANL